MVKGGGEKQSYVFSLKECIIFIYLQIDCQNIFSCKNNIENNGD